MRSTPSSSRARPSSERGFALVSALVLAVLYFGLIALLLLDSQRELEEARRFRARTVAETLAENAAELAALQIVTKDSTTVNASDWQGTMTGKMNKGASDFTIEGVGVTAGVTEARAKVVINGRMVDKEVRIQYTQHVY